MNKRKVVFFTGTMWRGGAERVISILSDTLVKRNWEVTIIMLLHNVSGGYKLNPQVKVLSFASDECKSLLKQIWLDIKLIRKYIKAEKPEVVVSFMGSNTLISWLACLGKNVRYIASERIDPNKAKRGFLFRTVIRWAYTRCEKVVFQTKRAKNYFNKKIQENGVIIGNPISVQCEATEKKEKKFVSVGRLSTQKNQKLLIDAFAEFIKLYPEYVLEVYGEGSLRKTLEDRIIHLGVEKNVFLMGSKLNVHEYIKDAQAFVLSSDYEGLSNALLEAMLMGLVCISTDCAGSDEIICNGENGFLVPVGDKDALLRAMIDVVKNEELSNKIGKNAKTSVECFKKENIIDDWMKVIEGDEQID